MRLSLVVALGFCLGAASAAVDNFVWRVANPTYNSLHHSLEGHSFETITDIHLESLCAQMCIKDSRCKSFNMLFEGSRCILNDDTDEANPQDLKPKNGSRYYRRADMSVDNDALGLCKTNPCKNNGRCIESCDGKGGRQYECICVDSNFEGQHCENEAEKPEWDEWAAFSDCSVSCDKGVQVRRRRCIDPTTKASRSTLDCYGSDVEFKSCDMGVCPFFSEWAAWSACDASTTCGQGSKKRARSCLHNGLVGKDRRCMGPAEEVAPCSGLTCENPVRLSGTVFGEGQIEVYQPKTNSFKAVCGQGFDKKAGDVACRQMGFVRAARVSSAGSTSKSFLITDVVCKGDEASLLACQHTSTESTDTCNVGPAKVECVVDGGWGDWSEFGACSVTCASGVRRRERKCDFPVPKNGGKQCVGESFQTTPCEEKPCPVDGVYKAWEDWSVCNKVCGGGEQTRTRECIEPQHGGKACQGVGSETRACNEQDCPVNGQWNPWSAWSTCSVSCGGGIRKSTRTCTEVAHGGKPCVGDTEKTEGCNDFACPVDGKWTKWGAWEECTVSCGGGTKTRERSCDGPFYGGADCVGDNLETAECGTSKCPVDGVLGKWSVWSDCSKDCGGGEQERTRECEGPFYGGKDCDGKRKEVQNCNVIKCPIDGTWEPWGKWSDCSKTCAGGITERTRTCHGPFYGGLDCDGASREDRECNKSPCPINGEWKAWGVWGSCSKSCGGGERKRTRECQGPQYGGDDCEGDEFQQIEECNTSLCPIDGVWGDWGVWGECDASGKQYATRECIGPQYGGNDCEGPREKSQDC